jgi:hypothetical protein
MPCRHTAFHRAELWLARRERSQSSQPVEQEQHGSGRRANSPYPSLSPIYHWRAPSLLEALKVIRQRSRDEARRRVLHGHELALLGDAKDAVRRLLRIELQSDAAPLSAQQVNSEVEVGDEALFIDADSFIFTLFRS